ncbi:RNA polymerase I-specific transcription initiation factor RRN3 [Neocloeon triangulifer]|uniref:RNA polymerase I-specific transcription initiation factor RRN3 n=1 Tax=Neocloeon triangulifer TaxID=2078957 RepID=UPI00286F06A9|nr:RNA polymerase I-specific transcription initiation factor RRN3 [Neocloeon triangulifer]
MSILRLEGTPRRASLSSLATPKVRFALPTEVESIVTNFINGTNVEAYQELLMALKSGDHPDENLGKLLHSCYSCINLLDQRVHALVSALIGLNWNTSSEALALMYQRFILELVATHSYYTKTVLENLLKKFYSSGDPWPGTRPSKEEEQSFKRVHIAIEQVLKIVPMSSSVLVHACTVCFPFMKRGAKMNQSYIYNLFKICEYHPEIRPQILSLIINKTIALDVQLPRQALEDMDEDEMETEENMDDTNTVFTMDDVSQSASKVTQSISVDMQKQLAQTLDLLMEQIFSYIQEFITRGEDGQQWKIFKELLAIFEQQMLLVHGSHHVQFFMFYLCTLQLPLAELFVAALWTKVTQLGEIVTVRQSAAHYLASLVARGRFLTVNATRCIIAQMCEWCHAYLAMHDVPSCDVKAHGVFYSVCQSLFYIIAFRHAELLRTEKGVAWMQSLGLAKLVTSRLNPLKPCLSAVAQNFAAVMRTYQIAYCYTVLERNARMHLPTVDQSGQQICSNLNSFFPFDPYLLPRSAPFVVGHYQEYRALEQDDDSESEEDEEEEEMAVTPKKDSLFIGSGSFGELVSPKSKSSLERFSYSSTPGFKHI